MSEENLYAIVKDGVVENTIILKEGSSWKCPDPGCQIIKVTEETGFPDIGLTYSEGQFEQPIFEEELPNHGF
jgi:hypothetical protein